MKTKFTKGDWKVSNCGLSVNVDGNKVARAHSGSNVPYVEPSKYNAHLIAAAPEMYEMLEILTHTCRLMASKTPLKSEFEALQAGIEQVLSKARGE